MREGGHYSYRRHSEEYNSVVQGFLDGHPAP
jgi:hypothetical protein